MSAPLNTQRIQLGDLSTPYGVAAVTKHLQNLYNSIIPVVTGSGAPTSTPTKIAQQYIDQKNNNVYVAVNTNSASGWVKVS